MDMRKKRSWNNFETWITNFTNIWLHSWAVTDGDLTCQIDRLFLSEKVWKLRYTTSAKNQKRKPLYKRSRVLEGWIPRLSVIRPGEALQASVLITRDDSGRKMCYLRKVFIPSSLRWKGFSECLTRQERLKEQSLRVARVGVFVYATWANGINDDKISNTWGNIYYHFDTLEVTRKLAWSPNSHVLLLGGPVSGRD